MPATDQMTRPELEQELQQLREFVVNADFVMRARFCYYGICDCIDNTGSPYPSQWGADIVARAKDSAAVDERLKRFAG